MRISESYAESIRAGIPKFTNTKPGDQRGELTVLYASKLRDSSHVKWICRCSCGNLALVRINNAKSCGCLLKNTHMGHRAKRTLDRETVLAIRGSTDKLRIVAERYGCSITTVHNIKSGHYYADIQ